MRRLLPPSWGIARLALGYGLGLALLTLCLALVSSAGIPLRSETVLVVTCLLLAAASASLLFKKRPSQPLSRIDEGERPAARFLRLDLWQIGFILLAILAAFLSIGKGFSATDEIVLWGVKGYGIAADGAIQTVTRWGTNTTTYPLHIPLAIAAASLLLGEVLPAAKLLFPAFGLALSLFLYQVLLQLGLHRSLAGLTTLAAITTAHIFRHATLAYANLSLSFYLFAAVALLAQALANGGTRPASGAMLLSGMMFAMAAWTRPEGLALSWLMIGVILLADFFIRGMRVRWENLALLIPPLLAYSAFWIWLKSAVYARPLGRADLMEQAAKQILVGHMHFSEAVYVGRTFIASLFQVESGDGLGIFVLIVALTLVLILILRRPRFPGGRIRLSDTPALQAALLMALSGCTYLLAIIGMYYLISYDATHDISWWVNTGLERMLMPGTLLAWAGGVVWLQSLLSRQAEAPLPSPGN